VTETYRFIAGEATIYPAAILCRVLSGRLSATAHDFSRKIMRCCRKLTLAVHDHLPAGLLPADNRCKAQENKMSKVIARRWQGKVSAERAEEYAQ
jgi:hypothetical protein